MKDFDLDAKLKSVRVPERPKEYWENFPAQVRFQLRHPAPSQEIRAAWLPPFAWKLGVSLAGLVVGLLVLSQPLKAATGAIFQKEQFVRRQLTALPGHLRVLITDEHGLHYLVADKE
jgi:hypothetical protein